MIGQVYRAPHKDRHGDTVDDDGNPIELLDPNGLCHIGTITDIVMGGLSSRPVNTRGEVADTTGLLGVPVAGFLPVELPFTLGELKVRSGDRVIVDNVTYAVVGPRMFDYPNSLTGTDFRRYWINVKATTN